MWKKLFYVSYFKKKKTDLLCPTLFNKLIVNNKYLFMYIFLGELLRHFSTQTRWHLERSEFVCIIPVFARQCMYSARCTTDLSLLWLRHTTYLLDKRTRKRHLRVCANTSITRGCSATRLRRQWNPRLKAIIRREMTFKVLLCRDKTRSFEHE